MLVRREAATWLMDWSLTLHDHPKVECLWFPLPPRRYNQDQAEVLQAFPDPEGIYYDERHGNRFIYWSAPRDRNQLRIVRVVCRINTYDIERVTELPSALQRGGDPEYTSNTADAPGLHFAQEPAKTVLAGISAAPGSCDALIAVDRTTRRTVQPCREWNFGLNNALTKKRGECGSIASTFVGLCRGKGVAARSVFAFHTLGPSFGNHAFSEFYAPGHGWYPRQSIPGTSVFPITKECVVLTEGMHLTLPNGGPYVPWWTYGAITRTADDVATLENKTYRFVRSDAGADGFAADAAREFVESVTRSDMNSPAAREATERFTSLWGMAMPEIVTLLGHRDARPRYWCAWFLAVVFGVDQLRAWLAIHDLDGSFRSRILNALPSLGGLGCRTQYEALCKTLQG